MNASFDFTGRTVIVTGGTRGIGRGIAEHFLSAGASVVVCGRKAPDTLPRGGDGEAIFTAADVTDPNQIDAVVSHALDNTGRLDVLINNAGGAPPADAATVSPRFSEAIIALNFTSSLHFAQRANAAMQLQSDGGVVVNISSVSALRPSPGTAAYGGAKAGLLSLTQSLAVEWAPRVRVNAVTAGLIETELSGMHYGGEDGMAAVASTVPLGRLGTPADVANACLFLASDEASYISGVSLVVHGGGERPAFLTAAATKELS